MTLTPIATQHIPHLWDWVRNGLEVVRATRPKCAWRCEDVYLELMQGHAHLYVIDAEDGFLVVKKQSSSYQQALFVWALWAPAGTMLRHKHKLIAALDDLARSAGCSVIRMDTTREAEWVAMELARAS